MRSSYIFHIPGHSGYKNDMTWITLLSMRCGQYRVSWENPRFEFLDDFVPLERPITY